MFHKLFGWLRDPSDEPEVDDPVAQRVEHRQRVVAERLSKITGQNPDDLLDYRRADRILGDGR